MTSHHEIIQLDHVPGRDRDAVDRPGHHRPGQDTGETPDAGAGQEGTQQPTRGAGQGAGGPREGRPRGRPPATTRNHPGLHHRRAATARAAVPQHNARDHSGTGDGGQRERVELERGVERQVGAAREVEADALASYRLLFNHAPLSVVWDAILLLEYKDIAALARRDEVKADVRVKLAQNDPTWLNWSKDKSDIRREKALVICDAIPLPES